MFSLRDHITTRRFPPMAWLLLGGIVLLGGMVTLPQKLAVGPISGLGAATMLGCGGAWLLWLARPYFPREQLKLLLPLLLFNFYAVGSLLWQSSSMKALQLLCVLLGFFGFVLLAARETEHNPRLAERLHKLLDFATLFSTAAYALSVPLFGLGAENILLARAFALFAMLGVARQLSLWQAGDRWAFLRAAVIVLVVFLSMSRVALVAALFLFPLAAASRGDWRGFVKAAVVLAVGAAALTAGILLNDEMNRRFFGYDADVSVGGVAINTSGRTEVWSTLWRSAQESLVFGHGVGSAGLLVDRWFPRLGHPHNDFLRFLHDFGMIGVGCWLAFLFMVTVALRYQVLWRARANDRELPIFLTPLLALVALTASMFTDNAVTYSFVMAPMGVLLGCALGRMRGESASASRLPPLAEPIRRIPNRRSGRPSASKLPATRVPASISRTGAAGRPGVV